MSAFKPPAINFDRSRASDIRTLPELVEFHVENNPEHEFCNQAEKSLSEDGAYSFTPVSYKRLQQAIFRCQVWLKDSAPSIHASFVGDDGKVSRYAPVAVLMESHVGLAILILTLMGMGVPVVLLSTRLSPLAVRHLIRATQARHAVVSPRLQQLMLDALSSKEEDEEDQCDVEVCVAPDYGIFLEGSYMERSGKIANASHFVSENDRQALILHSSGTSGLPKPIYCSHRHFLGFATCHNFSYEIEALNLTISTSPFFHGFGLVPMCMSLGIGKTMCLPPASTIPTGSSVAALIEASGAKALMTVPSIIEEIALLQDDRGVRILRSLDFVTFGGGIPKESVGNRLKAAGVRLLNHYGATETGPMTPFFVPPASYDWHYIKLRRDTFAPLEVQLDPIAGQERTFKMSMRPFGWHERFELQDLLVSKPGSSEEDMEFSIKGRTDDLICLATGEKVRPTILESLLQQHERVKAATAFGNGRFELGVIVESTEALNPAEIESFKTSIWPIIEEAGHAMDAHARLSSRAAVLVFPPGSLPRSDKGTVLRLEVDKRFSKEIDEAYRNIEANVTALPLNVSSPAMSIRKLLEEHVELKVAPSNDEDDLFELGMDSLQTVKLRRLLIASLKATNNDANDVIRSDKVSEDFIYRNPSIAKLAKAVMSKYGLVNGSSDSSLLEQLADKYSGRINMRRSKKTVVITGATGSLGSYFLNALLMDSSVAHVVCLNRSSKEDPIERQKEALRSRGIIVDEKQFSKVQVLETNTATSHLGLDVTQYDSLARDTTHIVHMAWPMNFKMGLSSFDATFRTLQNLVQLTTDAHDHSPWKRPRLLFISSISTVGNYPSVEGEQIVPEKIIDNPHWSLELGYAKAKLVCEMIIQRAAEDHPEIEVGLVRIGQIAGAGNGYWNVDEHFTALVVSSQSLGKLPDLRGTLSWIRVDSAATVLADILFHSSPLQPVYHLENPVRQSWQDVTAILAKALRLPESTIVTLDDWLDSVKSGPDERNPARNLLTFFSTDFVKMSSGSVILDTAVTRSVSSTLRKTSQIEETDLAAYVDYWRSVGQLRQN